MALQYIGAVLVVAFALQLTLLLRPLMEQNVFLLFFAAVVVVAWHGSPGPTLLAAISSALIVNYFFFHRTRFPNLDLADLPQLGIFMIVSLVISLLSARRGRAEGELSSAHKELETKIRKRTAELATANEAMQSEIAERKRSEEALRATEDRYRELFRQIKSAVAVYEACADGEDFVFKDFNPAGEQIEKVRTDDLIGKRVTQVFPGIRKMGLLEVFQRVWRTGMPEHHPTSIYEDGHISGWRENSVYKLRTGEIVAVYDDVTERWRAEEALRESEERFSVFMANLPAGAFIKDAAGRILFANRYLQELLGFQDWEGQTTLGLVSGEAGLRMTEDDRQALEHGPVVAQETVVDCRGISRTFETYKFPIRIERKPVLLAGIAVDVTGRTLAEEAQRQAEQKYRSLFEHAVEGIFQSSPEGRFFTVNPALARTLGYSSPEEVISTVQDIAHQLYVDPERRREYARLLEEQGFVIGFECQSYRKDKSIIWVSFSTRAIRSPEGKVLRYEGTVEDITERKRLEAQFRQAQKMEAIGILAGGVAHDFNNLLTVINGYTDSLLSEVAKDDPKRGDLEQIKQAGERAVSLTSQLLAFSRRQILQPRILDLNDAVAETSSIIRRLIGEDVDLNAVARPDLGLVKADPGQIQQIIMNLAVNAREAMPQGGRLTIETANADLDEEYVRRRAVVPAGRYVMLAISDNGIGMDAETQSRIFEPFFTTKGPGKGTGLGLSTVYGIVKQSGGFIWVYSEPGSGTTFKIYLPRVEGKAITLAGDEKAQPALRGIETVLVVEDDSAARTLIMRVLRERGYTVIEASDSREALRIAQEYAREIHLLLTDVVMPETSGKALASQIEAARPGIKVLFVSGYTSDAIVHHGVLDSSVAFLSKPFKADALARKVREVLDSIA
ncbi:MAG: PAS domain S-box protein [Acidobacteriia bacterium]|nr:PAS domain S-box protein [Terriglobia bacterium]